jgi:hypothetical protein
LACIYAGDESPAYPEIKFFGDLIGPLLPLPGKKKPGAKSQDLCLGLNGPTKVVP